MPVATKGTATVTLPSEKEILITREFAGSRRTVWRAWTEPELLRRWWGGSRGTMTLVEVDLRVGGRWRYVMGAGDQEVAFHGDFREIVPEQRIVTTEVYEGVPEPAPGEEVVNVVTFTERDGRTTLELLVVCPDQATRDAIMGSGMEGGMQDQYDTLDELVSALQI
jgi:uncharacterized protein YndB with AHSA1/START domain